MSLFWSQSHSSSTRVDNINDFPGEILTHLLSFLPTSEAFRITVLSKRRHPLVLLTLRSCHRRKKGAKLRGLDSFPSIYGRCYVLHILSPPNPKIFSSQLYVWTLGEWEWLFQQMGWSGKTPPHWGSPSALFIFFIRPFGAYNLLLQNPCEPDIDAYSCCHYVSLFY